MKKEISFSGALTDSMAAVITFLENYEGDFLIQVLSVTSTWNGNYFDTILIYEELK